MAEITWDFPGSIAYNGMHIKATSEELGVEGLDAYALGVAHAVFTNLFTQGLQAGQKIDVSPPKGETVEVSEDVSVKNLAEQSMEETKAILEAGLGSTTEVAGMKFTKIGTSPFPEPEVPWKKAVKADPKPWEEPSATIADDDDF